MSATRALPTTGTAGVVVAAAAEDAAVNTPLGGGGVSAVVCGEFTGTT
jgi:hypothetical protein